MAKDLNLFVCTGRAGSDAEIKQLPSGDNVANVSIAVGNQYTDKSGQKVEKTMWLRLVCFGKLASVFQYVTKGKQVQVTGELEIQEYNDKNTGEKKFSTQIRVTQLQLLGGPDNARTQSTPQAGGVPAYAGKQPEAASGGGGFEDDIPFAARESYP